MFEKRKIFTALAGFLLLAGSVMAQTGGLVYHEIQIVDELGRNVTSITTVTIYAPGTTSAATIYKDSARKLAITQAMTTSSTNTTLANGRCYWYGPDGWDYTISDGTNTHTNGGHASLNASNAKLVFPSYLQSISSTTYTDAQTATFGSGGDWVIKGGATADLLSFTNITDNAEFRIGASGTAANASLNLYVGTAIGLKIDSSGPTFTWDGGIANINASSNFATNINTGSSTGAINLGSSTSGAWLIDGTSTGTIRSDEAMTITTTDASADITIDAAAGSVIVRGTEAIADAIWLDADAGGVDITAAATFDVDVTATGGRIIATASENVQNTVHIEANGGVLESINLYSNQGTGASAATEHDASIQLQSDSGGIGVLSGLNAANAIRLETNGGTSETIILHSNQGTGAASINLLSDVGGITATASAGAIVLNAVGGTAGDVTVAAGDILTLTSVNTKIFDGAAAETWIIEGTANTEETSIVFTDPTADVVYTFPTATAMTVSVMSSTLVTNAPEIANSVTGGTNSLIFEGTADGYEIILAAADCTTADHTLTLPDDTGYFAYIAEAGTTTKDATDASLPITDAVVIGTSDATSAWVLPNGEEGQILCVVIGTDGGAATITPATASGCGWATAVLTDDIDGISFLYVNDTVGWMILGTFSDGTNIVAITQ